MLVVYVPSLLLHLSLPFVLLLAHLVEDTAARATGTLLHCQRSLQAHFFVDMFLVSSSGRGFVLVQKRVQAHQEQHVHGEQRYDPDDKNHEHTDGGGVAAFVAAFASRAEFALAAFDVRRLW